MYLNVKWKLAFFILAVGLTPSVLQAHGDTKNYYQLSSAQIVSFFSGKTLKSVNQHTQKEVLTYLGKDGNVKQFIKSAVIRRSGKWHAANDQLCLKWGFKWDEYCFDEVLYHDDEFLLIKDDKAESIITDGLEGDQTGF